MKQDCLRSAWAVRLPVETKLVLLRLAMSANDAGGGKMPGIRQLASWCSISVDAAVSALVTLQDEALLDIADGSRSPTYRLTLEMPDSPSG
jgi:hypothetical protein